LLQATNFILPLLTLPYLVRVLGTDKFGQVMFAQAFIVFFNVFVDFGFKLSATREISIHREDSSKLVEIYSSIMIIKVILLSLTFAILCLIVFTFDKFSEDWELYLLTYLMVLGQAMFPIWYFQGMERMKLVTIVGVISKLIFTVLIFIVIQSEDDYILVPVINGIGFIIGGILSLYIIHKTFKQKMKFVTLKTIKHYFLDSSQYFFSRVSVTLYTASNAFVLGIFTNNTMVGHYSIAEKLYQALQQAYQPIVQTLYPYVAKSKNTVLFKKVFWGFMLLNIVGIIMLYFFGSYIFDLLFTNSLGLESLNVFNILLLAALIVVPTIFLGYPFLGALGHPKYANLSVVYGSVFHIFTLTLLVYIDNLTIYTVAYAVLATELLVLCLRLYWVHKKQLWSYEYKEQK